MRRISTLFFAFYAENKMQDFCDPSKFPCNGKETGWVFGKNSEVTDRKPAQIRSFITLQVSQNSNSIGPSKIDPYRRQRCFQKKNNEQRL